MKFLVSLFMSLCLCVAVQAQVSVIPIPNSVQMKDGMMELPRQFSITTNDAALDFSKDYIIATFARSSNVDARSGAPLIKLVLDKKLSTKPEAYVLNSGNGQIEIKGASPAGVFYGVQTLMQLLPPQIFSREKIDGIVWQLPLVTIKDEPRVGWRGLMLDVSRHFFTVDEVKLFIDNMVRYKYNMLHLGLSNDEGFRIEIKSLPKLTQVGAWRVNKTGNFGTFSHPLPNEPKDYGGFYTQEQMKDIIRYAAQRYVQIVPEINMPGHSLAIVASYPEVSCTPGAASYNVRAGEPIMDWSRGAPPIALIDNTVCPANEKTYELAEKIIKEIAALFPFEYIHMGGDEAPHNFWEKSPQVQALMKKEGLKTIPQVQAYFEKRIEKIVNKYGKKMMGWDELLEGGVNTSTAIMSWRGDKPGREASNAGHKVVMSPNSYAYLDLMQGDVATDPRVYQTLRFKKSYEMDPIPAGARVENILGGQANLWTEQIYNMRQAEYMLWPRAFAISESLWSLPEQKNYTDFVRRVEEQLKRLDASETKYSPAMYEPIIQVSGTADAIKINMQVEVDNITLHYSFDHSTPDYFYPAYSQTLTMPKDAGIFRVQAYRGKKPMGRLISISKADLINRLPKKK